MAGKEYTWADLEAAVGQDFSGGVERTGADPVEWSVIRRYCEPIELGCPIHYDEAAARAAGYRGVVLPISAINSTFTSAAIWQPGMPTKWGVKDAHATFVAEAAAAAPELPKPATAFGFVTDIEIEYHEPVVVGDRLTAKGRKLLSVNVRETSVGMGAFMVFEGYIYNQRGELVAVQRNGLYQYNPHSPEKLAELRAQQRGAAPARSEGASAAPVPAVDYAELARTKQPRSDWSQQLFWEDVKEGDEVPPVAMNITVQRLVIEAGANRDFNPIHHDTVLTQKTGVQEMYANNGFIQGMWDRCIREYIGVQGRVRKSGPYRIKNFNEAGMTATTLGKVTRKWQEDGKNLVELEIWTENDRNGRTVSVGPGPVLVELPSRNGAGAE